MKIKVTQNSQKYVWCVWAKGGGSPVDRFLFFLFDLYIIFWNYFLFLCHQILLTAVFAFVFSWHHQHLQVHLRADGQRYGSTAVVIVMVVAVFVIGWLEINSSSADGNSPQEQPLTSQEMLFLLLKSEDIPLSCSVQLTTQVQQLEIYLTAITDLFWSCVLHKISKPLLPLLLNSQGVLLVTSINTALPYPKTCKCKP